MPAAAAATEEEDDEEALAPCPMMSAKSSPLMVADMREVKMGVALNGLLPGTPCEGGEEEAEGEEDGLRLRKKWLGLTKLWKDK